MTITGGEELSPIGTNVTYSCDSRLGLSFIVEVPGLGSYETLVVADVAELEARGITFEDDGSQFVLTVFHGFRAE